jgi:hypothetical protein
MTRRILRLWSFRPHLVIFLVIVLGVTALFGNGLAESLGPASQPGGQLRPVIQRTSRWTLTCKGRGSATPGI